MKRLGTSLLLLIATATAGFSQDSPKQTPGVTAKQKARIDKELNAGVAEWEKADAAGTRRST